MVQSSLSIMTLAAAAVLALSSTSLGPSSSSPGFVEAYPLALNTTVNGRPYTIGEELAKKPQRHSPHKNKRAAGPPPPHGHTSGHPSRSSNTNVVDTDSGDIVATTNARKVRRGGGHMIKRDEIDALAAAVESDGTTTATTTTPSAVPLADGDEEESSDVGGPDSGTGTPPAPFEKDHLDFAKGGKGDDKIKVHKPNPDVIKSHGRHPNTAHPSLMRLRRAAADKQAAEDSDVIKTHGRHPNTAHPSLRRRAQRMQHFIDKRSVPDLKRRSLLVARDTDTADEDDTSEEPVDQNSDDLTAPITDADLNPDEPVDVDADAADAANVDETVDDDDPDVPDDLSPDPGTPEEDAPIDGPEAAGSTDPKVLKQGKNYVWNFKNFAVRSMKPLGIRRDIWGGVKPNVNRQYVKNPANSKEIVLRVNYPKGTSTPTSKHNPKGKKGGTGLSVSPIGAAILSKAKYVTLEYDVFFPKGYNFNRGGKLPGMFGGSGNRNGCSGGNDGSGCFSLRYMWRAKGAGEAYLYIPKNAKQDSGLCKIKPYTHCDPTYGSSIGRGSFYFKTGKWTHVKQLVQVNSIGKQNGVLKVWANGKLAISFNKMVWRTSDKVTVQGVTFETFFGGSTPDAAAQKNEYSMFKNFQMVAAY